MGVLKNLERILRWSALRSDPFAAAAVERSKEHSTNGFCSEEHSTTVVCSRLEGSGEHSSLIGFI